MDLKISNIYENTAEFVKRVKKAHLPGWKSIAESALSEDWDPVLHDIIYRFEGYVDKGVLNYGRNTKLKLSDFFHNVMYVDKNLEEVKTELLNSYFE